MKRIFISIPSRPETHDVYDLIHDVITDADNILSEEIESIRFIDTPSTLTILNKGILDNINKADLIIADISNSSPNVMYELGVAHSMEKPVILIREMSFFNNIFDPESTYTLTYDKPRLETSFKHKLLSQVTNAIRNPEKFSHPFSANKLEQDKKPTVFVSYSHTDSEFLARLKVHLKPLERENRIDLWDDTRIVAGNKWKEEIEKALDKAAIAVLLISADFLASDFVVDNELPPLLQAAEKQGTTILPIILKPCRFSRDKNLSKFQAINNPATPLISQNIAEQEKTYAQLSERIEDELNVIL
jgi:hypothetical protein